MKNRLSFEAAFALLLAAACLALAAPAHTEKRVALVSAPWRASGTASHAFSMPSSQMNALTTSATPDMLQV
jgi:hypothetical protein